MAFDLSTLPAPVAITEPTLEALEERDLTRFKTLDEAYTYFMAADPVTKVVRHGSWREYMLRLYMNNVARARLLAFATGGDLDQIAFNEGLERMLVDEGNSSVNPPIPATYESDSRLRERILAHKTGRNGAGSVAYYREHALGADARVRDVNVYSPDFPDGFNMGGRVAIAVLSYEDTGVPSIDLLERVNFALKQPSVRVVSDQISVEAARPAFVTIKASILLKQTAPIEIYTSLADIMADAFENKIALGEDVTLSWITKTLAIDGVHDVILEEPTESIKVSPSQFPSLLSLSLSFGGFDKIDDYRLSDAERSSIYDRVYRYYYDSCVRYKRSAEDIALDLNKVDREGIIQPTTVGFAVWLGLTNLIVDPVTHLYLPEDEIAFMIYESLQIAYNAAS